MKISRQIDHCIVVGPYHFADQCIDLHLNKGLISRIEVHPDKGLTSRLPSFHHVFAVKGGHGCQIQSQGALYLFNHFETSRMIDSRSLGSK